MWDENKKQWVDKNAESDGSVNNIKPPPMASELRSFPANVPDQNMAPSPYMGSVVAQATSSNPAFGVQGNSVLPNVIPQASANNIYKLQKGRGNGNC